MGLMKPRVSSYVDRGNELIAKGKTKQAMNLVSHGLQYYSERVIDSISPYAKNDAGLIVLVLRHLADEVEKNNPGAKELAAGMEKCVGKPSLQDILGAECKHDEYHFEVKEKDTDKWIDIDEW